MAMTKKFLFKFYLVRILEKIQKKKRLIYSTSIPNII